MINFLNVLRWIAFGGMVTMGVIAVAAIVGMLVIAKAFSNID